jgi:hypothetical protein
MGGCVTLVYLTVRCMFVCTERERERERERDEVFIYIHYRSHRRVQEEQRERERERGREREREREMYIFSIDLIAEYKKSKKAGKVLKGQVSMKGGGDPVIDKEVSDNESQYNIHTQMHTYMCTCV